MKKWHFRQHRRGVECVITITRQKPETLFSFIKQIGHMLGMVFTLLRSLRSVVSERLCFVTLDGKHESSRWRSFAFGRQHSENYVKAHLLIENKGVIN